MSYSQRFTSYFKSVWRDFETHLRGIPTLFRLARQDQIRRRFRSDLILLPTLLVSLGLCAPDAYAKVTVLTNRTLRSLPVEILRAGQPGDSLVLPSGDSLPVFFPATLRVRYGSGLQRKEYELVAGSAYYFALGIEDSQLHLQEIGLGKPMRNDLDRQHKVLKVIARSATVPVKLLVDDDEPTHRKIWEARLRNRVADASKILERHSGIRLKVVAVSTWDSEDAQHDFSQAMREFEREVMPSPASLAIGFSSQYKAERGRIHMGGTRGPLHPYILLKERSPNLRETERLELLVHELGHFLGASHSPEPQSVMRPLLTGALQRRVGARIQFDPVNTLLMGMLGEEVRMLGVRRLSDVSAATKERMLEIYRVLDVALPQDPAASQYLQIIARSSSPPLVEDTRRVLQELVEVGKQQRRIPTGDVVGQNTDLTGDELTSLYVRTAAKAALQVRPENQTKAMVLALGVFMDDTDTLRSFPVTARLIKSVESEAERRQRTSVLGAPTMRRRRDLAKHFFVSAHALVVAGREATRSVGLAKEMMDAQRGTGFSFADMAANRAGIVFAERLLSEELSLTVLADQFHVDDYLPSIADLAEGLRSQEIQDLFGGTTQRSLADELDRIEQRVLALPVYERPSQEVVQ